MPRKSPIYRNIAMFCFPACMWPPNSKSKKNKAKRMWTFVANCIASWLNAHKCEVAMTTATGHNWIAVIPLSGANRAFSFVWGVCKQMPYASRIWLDRHFFLIANNNSISIPNGRGAGGMLRCSSCWQYGTWHRNVNNRYFQISVRRVFCSWRARECRARRASALHF